MLLKHWNLILIFLTFSIISCESSKNEPEVNSTPSFPVGREFNVSLNIAPFLEVAEQPLSRSTSTVADGIYAVNVFWKGKGLTSFQPYASGLFDNPYRVEIGLIEGYVYRLTAASWDIKTAHIIQYKVTAYFMDFLFHLLCRKR